MAATEWMTAREAAGLLKVSPSWVKRHRREGHLKEWKQDGQRFLYARREIETILNSPEYGWRMQKRAKTLEKRKGYLPPKPTRYPQQAAARNGLISSREAREILGISRTQMSGLIQRGKLWCVQNYPGQAGSKFWFRREDVERFRDQRAREKAGREHKRATRPPPRPPDGRITHRFPKGSFGHRVEVGDLSERERYFGEWLTTRQVAWMLHTNLSSVYRHYERGHIRARSGPPGKGKHWQFWKADVVALMNDRAYCRRRVTWERTFGDKMRARQKAAHPRR